MTTTVPEVQAAVERVTAWLNARSFHSDDSQPDIRIGDVRALSSALSASEARVAALEEELRGSSRSQPVLSPKRDNAGAAVSGGDLWRIMMALTTGDPDYRVTRALEAISSISERFRDADVAQRKFDSEMVEEIIETIESYPSGRFSDRQKVELIRELFSREGGVSDGPLEGQDGPFQCSGMNPDLLNPQQEGSRDDG